MVASSGGPPASQREEPLRVTVKASWRSLKTGPPGRPQHQSWLGVLSDTRAFSASFLLSPGQSCVLHLTLYHLHLVLTPDCITANVAITWLSVRMEQNYVSYN